MFGWLKKAPDAPSPRGDFDLIVRAMKKGTSGDQRLVLDALLMEVRRMMAAAADPQIRFDVPRLLDEATEARRAAIRSGATSEADPRYAKPALVEAWYGAFGKDKSSTEHMIRQIYAWADDLGVKHTPGSEKSSSGADDARSQELPPQRAKPSNVVTQPQDDPRPSEEDLVGLGTLFDHFATEISSEGNVAKASAARGLNLIYSIYRKEYPTDAVFMASSDRERDAFVQGIASSADECRAEIGQYAGTGAFLCVLWLTVLAAEGDLAAQMEQRLIALGRSAPHLEDPNRASFRQEFEKATQRLRAAAEAVQVAVGHSINMANSTFHKTYGSLEAFERLSHDEQHAYIENLTRAEKLLRDKQRDEAASLGFGLFKMWVGAVTASDRELVDQFASELAYFSRKGDLGPGRLAK